MRKFMILAILAAAYWYWHNGYSFTKSPVAVDAKGHPAVLIFTFNNCGQPCDDARQELNNRNVPFQEKRINGETRETAEGDDNFVLWQKYSGGVDNFPLIVAGKNSHGGFNVQAIASLLGKTFGDKYLTDAEKRYFSKHFNSDGTPRIVMYGASWCPYCKALREEFNAHGTPYTEVDVENSGEHQLIVQTMSISGYPVTYVGYTRVRNGDQYSAVMSALKNY